MYSTVIQFLEKSNCIYPLQFGFRKNHSTNDTLINITENSRSALHNGKFACGIFVYLQKAFDTVDLIILLKKLEHYGIRGIGNSWFKSYLDNRSQFVSISGLYHKFLQFSYNNIEEVYFHQLIFDNSSKIVLTLTTSL